MQFMCECMETDCEIDWDARGRQLKSCLGHEIIQGCCEGVLCFSLWGCVVFFTEVSSVGNFARVSIRDADYFESGALHQSPPIKSHFSWDVHICPKVRFTRTRSLTSLASLDSSRNALLHRPVTFMETYEFPSTVLQTWQWAGLDTAANRGCTHQHLPLFSGDRPVEGKPLRFTSALLPERNELAVILIPPLSPERKPSLCTS